MAPSTSITDTPAPRSWIDYCEQLVSHDFDEVLGVSTETVFDDQSIYDMSEVLNSQYPSANAVPEKIRKAQEAYLGLYILHYNSGRWIQLAKDIHGLEGVGIFIESDESIAVPSELWQLLFQQKNIEMLLAALKTMSK
ncbi:MAG: hypothetical protein Q3976_07890 [Corynebacterium sp.]|nr:hypothetical protein [Corynebacterium sp.]